MSALFGIVLVGSLAAAIFSIAGVQNKVMLSQEQAVRARLLAESGVTHALAAMRGPLASASFTGLLRGADNAKGGSDDGYLINFAGLGDSLNVPVAGRSLPGGTFTVRILDDPMETDGDSLTDMNGRVLVRCTGTTADGATSTLNVILSTLKLPAVTFDGNVTMGGNARILGPCADVHANGRMSINGSETLEGRITATDSVVLTGGGGLQRPDGSALTGFSRQQPVEVPKLNPMDYCSNPRLILNADGTVTRRVAGVAELPVPATLTAASGWRYDLTYKFWVLETNLPEPGTVCAMGNVYVTRNIGTALAPIPMSIIATGSVYMGGSPFIKPTSPGDPMIMAGGDLQMSGSASAGGERNYEGLLYANSQCKFMGNPRIAGQVICKNEPTPSTAYEITATNDIAGNPEITYNCTDSFGKKRRFVSWYPTFGQ